MDWARAFCGFESHFTPVRSGQVGLVALTDRAIEASCGHCAQARDILIGCIRALTAGRNQRIEAPLSRLSWTVIYASCPSFLSVFA